METKLIYIITTYKCSACKCIETILRTIQTEYCKNVYRFDIIVKDCSEVPEWLKSSVKMTDFPTVIFIENDIIKYHFTGTMPQRKLIQLMKDINF